MLLGVLDIGSNSAQLQVFEARSGAPPLPTHAVKEPTLLGEAFGPDGDIDPAGVDRVVVAVNKTMTAARQLGVQQLYVFTTSAVRDAANRDLILDRVEAEAGVRPQYLSGEAEARLTYLAVHQWSGWSAGRLLTFKQLARLTGAPAQRKGPFVRRRVTARDIDTWIPRLAALQAQERARLPAAVTRAHHSADPGRIVAGLADDLVDVPARVSCFPGQVPAMRPVP